MRVAFTRRCIFSLAAFGLLGGCAEEALTLPPERLDAGADARVDAGPDARPMPAPTLAR